jgi:hypothetical protein
MNDILSHRGPNLLPPAVGRTFLPLSSRDYLTVASERCIYHAGTFTMAFANLPPELPDAKSFPDTG